MRKILSVLLSIVTTCWDNGFETFKIGFTS